MTGGQQGAFSSTWARARDVIWMEASSGGLLLLADGREQPVHVGHPGLEVWRALESPCSLRALGQALGADDPGADLLGDVRALLAMLEDLGLVVEHPAGHGEVPQAEALG